MEIVLHYNDDGVAAIPCRQRAIASNCHQQLQAEKLFEDQQSLGKESKPEQWQAIVATASWGSGDGVAAIGMQQMRMVKEKYYY